MRAIFVGDVSRSTIQEQTTFPWFGLSHIHFRLSLIQKHFSAYVPTILKIVFIPFQSINTRLCHKAKNCEDRSS